MADFRPKVTRFYIPAVITLQILIQNDIAEGQGDAAGALGFDAVNDVGFLGGNGVLPFIARGA